MNAASAPQWDDRLILSPNDNPNVLKQFLRWLVCDFIPPPVSEIAAPLRDIAISALDYEDEYVTVFVSGIIESSIAELPLGTLTLSEIYALRAMYWAIKGQNDNNKIYTAVVAGSCAAESFAWINIKGGNRNVDSYNNARKTIFDKMDELRRNYAAEK
jgi:hypothetical protein